VTPPPDEVPDLPIAGTVLLVRPAVGAGVDVVLVRPTIGPDEVVELVRLLLLPDQELKWLRLLATPEPCRRGGHGSVAGPPVGLAATAAGGAPCGTQLLRGGVSA
jgi:hypothetical protein